MTFSRWCNAGRTRLQLSVFNTVEEIDKSEWKYVTGTGNLYLSLPYLSALETGLSPDVRFRYLVLRHPEKGPVGVAYVQFLKFTGNRPAEKEELCFIGKTIKDRFIDPSGVKVMVCGNAFACGENGMAWTSDLPKEEIFAAFSEAFDEIMKKERKHFDASFVLLKEFMSGAKAVDAFTGFNFRPFEIDVNMIMPIIPAWQNFQDYLGSLTAKFRTKANQALRKSADMEVKDLSAADIAIHRHEIERLFSEVYTRASFKFGEINGATFHALKKNLGDQFVFRGYYYQDRLVGFSASFVFDHIADANLVGLDYSLNRELAIYQRMLYDFVDLAISRNCKELRLGRTAEEIKSCVGARPVHMKLFIRHRNRISNHLIKPMIDSVTPSKFELRMPFKAELA